METMETKLKYKKSESLKELERLFHEKKKKDHPNMPAHALVFTKFSDDSTNSLTAAVMAYLKVNNAFGARINVTGTYDTKLKRFRHSGSTKGMPDVSGIVKGKFVGLEIKFGNDIQSDRQKVIQMQIEEAGGLYYIAKDFESFKAWFDNEFNN
jgi:hypothetical protein